MPLLGRSKPGIVALTFILALILLCSWRGQPACNEPWTEVEEGLSVAVFDSPIGAETGDSKVTVVRIDPDHFDFRLLCASEHGKVKLTVKQWCEKYHLVAAVNAGMFQGDQYTSVGYMRNFDHVNNPQPNKDNAVLAFNRADSTVPEIQIIDRQYQDFAVLRTKYNTLIQSIRMVSLNQNNVWAQQPREWSMVAVGMDKRGDALFMFSRSPYSVHDFIDIVLGLPISLRNAMYLEGGPEASLYLSSGELEMELFGRYETSFFETDGNDRFWPIPNVIGIVRKE